MVDTSKPVRFYDDRGKTDYDAGLVKILYEDDNICLCEAAYFRRKDRPDPTPLFEESVAHDIILFRKKDGEVLTTENDAWYATNDMVKP